eukprot:scaffold277810_cov33-Prasinocladus_malaysianus.AAC.1
MPCNSHACCVCIGGVQMGFFANVGPLTVFVSSHVSPPLTELRFFCIPDDFSYSLQGEQYISADEMYRIEKGADVRLRITGAKYQNNSI